MRKNSLWYRFVRHTIVGSGLRLFYSSFTSSGSEKIPRDKPVVFVPNHQNSFMDALLVACSCWKTIHFLTRAEAFSPKPVGMLLRSLNMLPVYRVRDGLKSVKKNMLIFDQCYDYLANNESVLIFAEANHNLKRRIRPLSKGFTRVAFGAERKYKWNLDLQVIPVGISYGGHRLARRPVHVEYGDPIPVQNYRKQYEEDKNEASQTLKEDVHEAMKELTMHVQDLGDYPLYKVVLEDLENNVSNLLEPYAVNKRVKKLEKEASEEWLEEAKELDQTVEMLGIDLFEIQKDSKWKFSDYLFSPIYLFSFLNNIIPYQPVRYLIQNVIKDHAFDASIKFLTGLVLLPAFYGLVSLILWGIGLGPEWIWLYLLGSIFTAPAFIRGKYLFTSRDVDRLRKTDPKTYQKLKSQAEKFQQLRDCVFLSE